MNEAPQEPGTADAPRCGFVALIGAPNAGKSTLLNALVGAKVSIVTHKVQTTRAIIRGIAIEGAAQIVFVDTPGIFQPKRRLDRAMVTTAWGGAMDADLVVLVVDARKGVTDEVGAILDKLADVPHRKVLALNKIDTMRRDELLAVVESINARGRFDETFLISALTGDGVPDLGKFLAGNVPEGPWHYPEDQISDLPMRSLAAEITREKLTLRLHEELPYMATVETEAWEEFRNGSVRIQQTVYVSRDSHKKILLGKEGRTVKAISKAAREDIAEAIGQPVHLFLFVKVREKWVDDPERYREMGLEFPR